MQNLLGGVSRGQDSRGRGLIVVSNRGPIEHYVDTTGQIRHRSAGGGVAVALSNALRDKAAIWLASSGGAADAEVASRSFYIPLGDRAQLRLLSINEAMYNAFYGTFANPVLWFIQHGLASSLDATSSDTLSAWRDGYVPVNRIFAEAAVRELDKRGSNQVMLHDYHFYLCARMIRRLRPNVALQHFTHIPWPRPDAWRVLPDAIVAQICRGLLGNDSVVFQTAVDAENFLDSCRVYLHDEAAVCSRQGEVGHEGRITRVWSNPISVDVDELERLSVDPDVLRCKDIVRRSPDEKLIVRVDRLDPSKNALRGFEAFELMLERDASMRGKVRFVAYLVPTRDSMKVYREYAGQVAQTVERINQRFGNRDWQPVQVIAGHDRPRAIAGLQQYDVLMVNSLADGMNLVAKEGIVVNRRDGALVLSRDAGACHELAEGALTVDPSDVSATAQALLTGLHMPALERRRRSLRLKHAVDEHQVSDWFSALQKDIDATGYIHRVFPYPSLMPSLQAVSA